MGGCARLAPSDDFVLSFKCSLPDPKYANSHEEGQGCHTDPTSLAHQTKTLHWGSSSVEGCFRMHLSTSLLLQDQSSCQTRIMILMSEEEEIEIDQPWALERGFPTPLGPDNGRAILLLDVGSP